MTVKEVSELTGVSIRALQYYDTLGLLKPAGYTEAGYRLYDEASLDRLRRIMLFRELEFPLKDIGRIIDAPGFDKNSALKQQIELLTMKKERLEKLIDLARKIEMSGDDIMDFTAFDKEKIDEYSRRAAEQWGATEQYAEYEQKAKYRTEKDQKALAEGLMDIFVSFGAIRNSDPASAGAQELAARLQDYITEHYYSCTKVILKSLGAMYADGGEFTANIDAAGGTGTAEFVSRTIDIYCERI